MAVHDRLTVALVAVALAVATAWIPAPAAAQEPAGEEPEEQQPAPQPEEQEPKEPDEAEQKKQRQEQKQKKRQEKQRQRAERKAKREQAAAAEERLGTLYAEYGTWVAQPVGLEYTPATRINPSDPVDVKLLQIAHGTDRRERVRAGYEFHNRVGEFMLTYFSHEDEEALGDSTPGVFQFGELWVHPFSAGFAEDGRADAFRATAATKMRDLRLDYYRPAFSNDRVRAKWFVGFRRFFHRRDQAATYFAVLTDLPVLLPPIVPEPRPDLEPLPDVAQLQSKYEGRGVEAGMEFIVPLWKDRLLFEAGFALGVLRGKFSTRYSSFTHLYLQLNENGEIVDTLAPPYSESFLASDVDLVQQFTFPAALNADGLSQSGQVLDASLGFRWKAWRGLDLLGGFRDTRYENVALELRPGAANLSASAVFNLEDASRIERSVAYEGFYLGVAYTY
jgi:hypothetical protein